MESWLLDVKRVRIPRPKFGGGGPKEPPKDYTDEARTAAVGHHGRPRPRDLAKATEELRRALQDKL